MYKVFVSGCFDMLHSGHIAFFEDAAKLGDLYVGIGSDDNIFNLKGRHTIYQEKERLYMVKSQKAVKDAFINSGFGLLDFEKEVKQLKPDILFVNEDGASSFKEEFCREHGITYMISKRIPHDELPVRSTTELRQKINFPYRIDLAGGWLDQPYVSKYAAGPVLTISLDPTFDFCEYSGMATSTRKKAAELWHKHCDVPFGKKEVLAKTLFCFENPPGKTIISGSQDSLGIVMPGLNRLYYDNNYWPEKITSVTDNDTLSLIEDHLYLLPTFPRKKEFDVLSNTTINKTNARRLSKAADNVWNTIANRDIIAFGKSFTASFNAQTAMFPDMLNNEILMILEQHKKGALGWKIAGAGGGGYLIFIAKEPALRKGITIKIRRE